MRLLQVAIGGLADRLQIVMHAAVWSVGRSAWSSIINNAGFQSPEPAARETKPNPTPAKKKNQEAKKSIKVRCRVRDNKCNHPSIYANEFIMINQDQPGPSSSSFLGTKTLRSYSVLRHYLLRITPHYCLGFWSPLPLSA